MTDRCPRHDQCFHPAKLRLAFDGTCVDCGTQVTNVGSRREVLRAAPAPLKYPVRERDSTPRLDEIFSGRARTGF